MKVLMPEMGESVTEGTVTRWLVAVGDQVSRDQPIIEVSTDKVDAEIPSPIAGTVQSLEVGEGDVVEVHDVLAIIGDAADDDGGDNGGRGADVGGDGGADAGGAETESDAASVETAAEAPAAVDEAASATAEPEASDESSRSADERGHVFATPVARRMAAKRGIDLHRVTGTGAQGRITKRDVEAHEPGEGTRPAPAAAAAPTGGKPAAKGRPSGDFHVAAYREGDDVDIEPMSRIRKLTAEHMIYSKATSAHVTTVFHIDMSRVVAVRREARARFERDHGTKLTYMPFIFNAVVRALRKHAKFNASIDGERIVYKKRINLGMAVALERGLIVPVIDDADRLSLAGLASKANDLADRARAKKLKPDEVHGGTFTVTNPGVFGSLFGTPIINQPEVAVLCIGAIEKRPVVVAHEGADAIAIRHMSYFALTYDHRLIDGADAEFFMQDVAAVLEGETWDELER